MADTTYGIRLRITPDQGGTNPFKTYTVLYRADTALGSKTEVARQLSVNEWTFDDTLPLNAGRKYYWIRSEVGTYTESSYIGPVDCEPTDIGTIIE